MKHSSSSDPGAWAIALALILAGCAGSPSPSGPQGNQGAAPRASTSIAIGVVNAVPAFSIMAGTTPVGGFASVEEVHSNGLITSDFRTRHKVPRLAEKVPSLDDQSISLLPDGRMRVVWPLRRDVTWHDGAPFTARDLTFSAKLLLDPSFNPGGDFYRQMESVEAPNDYTFVVNFKAPYREGTTFGVRAFKILPQHVLGPAYERYLANGNIEEVRTHPYWTSEWVHLGPFRLTSFDPTGEIVFRAYDGYFLGRPKVDTIRVQVFLDSNTAFANLLAGTIDAFFESVLDAERAFQLEDRWRATGDGTVVTSPEQIRILPPVPSSVRVGAGEPGPESARRALPRDRPRGAIRGAGAGPSSAGRLRASLAQRPFV